jgi:hypothetical protein
MPPTAEDWVDVWHAWYRFVAKAVHENKLVPHAASVAATPKAVASWCADVADALTETQSVRSKAFSDKLREDALALYLNAPGGG